MVYVKWVHSDVQFLYKIKNKFQATQGSATRAYLLDFVPACQHVQGGDISLARVMKTKVVFKLFKRADMLGQLY